MGLSAASAERVCFEGDIRDPDIEGFENALELLRSNPQVKVPVVDLSTVEYMPSRAIGALVTLWVDLAKEGRWFDFKASDKIWDLLGKVGVAGVFFRRPQAR
jgi:hypothetical protein